MSTTVTYKGNTLTTVENATKTLTTAGKYLEDNITLTDVTQGGTVTLVPYAIRPDAELVQTYTYDGLIVADEGVTLPAYTTTQQVLKAAANLTPTVPVDFAHYRYIVTEEFLTIPEYSVEIKAKGRAEYTWCNYVYEYTRADANDFATILDPTKKITSAQILVSANSLYRLLYWSSASAIALYATNGYGCYQAPSAPSASGSTMTVKSPAMDARGHSTYFTSTFMNALTDIRYQYVIKVYRAPLDNLNVDGWEQDQMLQHTIECLNSADHKLT